MLALDPFHDLFLAVDLHATAIWSFVLGCSVGMVELMSRHFDHRGLALRTAPSVLYIVLNGTMSLGAFGLIERLRPDWLGFDGKSGLPVTEAAVGATSTGNPILVVLAAGFGASAFFRSSVFKVRTADGDLAVGPSIVLDVFLKVIDEAVDRALGEVRIREVADIMAHVDFEKAAKNLPTFCFAALRRIPPEIQSQFAYELKALKDNPDLDDGIRAMSLGMSVMSLTGKAILVQAVRVLGQKIARSPTDPGQPATL